MHNQIYPDVYSRFSAGTLLLSSWVRVKRKGIIYEVLVHKTYIHPELEGKTEEDKISILFLNSIVSSVKVNYYQFEQQCKIIKYLWKVPSENTIKEMHKSQTLRISEDHLSEKERFLLNFQPFKPFI